MYLMTVSRASIPMRPSCWGASWVPSTRVAPDITLSWSGTNQIMS